jgi:hypothetical protein
MPNLQQIQHFNDLSRRLALVRPVTIVKENFGMRPVLADYDQRHLDDMLLNVKLHVILDHIAAATYEAADSCDGDARDSLMQQAANVSGAALFCKAWDPDK